VKVRGYTVEKRQTFSSPDGPIVAEPGDFVVVVVEKSWEKAAAEAARLLSERESRG
jgi:hypothetical protein